MSAKLIVLMLVSLFLPVGFAENLPKIFIVTTDNAELFYLKNGEPDGLERLPKGVQIAAENQVSERVFTTYKGKPAYIRSEFLVTEQEFAAAAEKAAAAAREQIAKAIAAKMECDIVGLRAHILDSKNSRSISDYDQTIGLFRKFLTAYPSSPYDVEINNRIAEWQAERDQVASGLIKYDGEWMTQAEFEQSHREDRLRTLLHDAGEYFKQKNWSDAARKYNAAIELHPGGGTEVVARRQLAASLDEWRRAIELNQKTAQQNQEKFNNELAQSQSAVKNAQADLNNIKAWYSTQTELGSGAKVSQAQTVLIQAESRVAKTQLQLSQLQTETGLAKHQLDEITQIANHVGLSAKPEPTTVVVASAASAPVESSDMTIQIADWFKRYWMIAAGVALLGLFIFSRILR